MKVFQKLRDILNDIKLALKEDDREQLRCLKHVERKKLREAVQEVNEVLTLAVTTDITETNRRARAAAIVVTRRLGIEKRTMGTRKEPIWKRRIKGKIDMLWKEISKLERKKIGQKKGGKGITQIEKKHSVRKKGMNVVTEELKQRVTAKAAKLRRFEQRANQYRQNRMFQYDQKKLYQELDRKHL